MANLGASPLDPSIPVGQVRLVIGDTEATNVTEGIGDYAYFSDDAITVALALGADSITRACAVLVKQLALALTLAGQSIAAGDFKINTLGKGKDLLEVAKNYDLRANDEEARADREENSSYAVVSPQLKSSCEVPAGLSGLLGR